MRNTRGNMSLGITLRKELSDLAIGVTGLTVLIGSCVGPLSWINSREQKAREAHSSVLWEEYRGTIPNYTVEISDSDKKNGDRQRIVHLNGVDEGIRPNRITGHDYNRDGAFDRIFIMQKQLDSCDSVYLTPEGAVWDPSPASKDAGKASFNEAQIIDAQRKLYEAVGSVKTDAHKYRHWVPGMSSDQNYGILEGKVAK